MSVEMTVEQAVELITGTIQRKNEKIEALRQELIEAKGLRDKSSTSKEACEK